LVKFLRNRLGLTQEQLAHEVGVTFCTVNQWENGHRRPQPFLLKRLLEMKAFVDNLPPPDRTKAAAPTFQHRRHAGMASEEEELAAMSIIEKLRQLAELMASAQNLGRTEALAAPEDEVRPGWAQLRRRLHD
jgi:transcriptional regulator with XRE-family HTH domain